MNVRSIFTNRVVVELPVPHDEGQSITIRKLAPRHLEAAAKESQRQSINDVKEAGGAKLVGEITREFKDPDKAKDLADAVKRDPLMTFDRVTLISKAVTAWSYEQALTLDVFEELDEETQQWLATEILKLSKPTLYETEADRKNG